LQELAHTSSYKSLLLTATLLGQPLRLEPDQQFLVIGLDMQHAFVFTSVFACRWNKPSGASGRLVSKSLQRYVPTAAPLGKPLGLGGCMLASFATVKDQ
jgi:hypothetical protein